MYTQWESVCRENPNLDAVAMCAESKINLFAEKKMLIFFSVQRHQRLQQRCGDDLPTAAWRRGVWGAPGQDGEQVGGLHRDRRHAPLAAEPGLPLHHDQHSLRHLDDDRQRRDAQRGHRHRWVRPQPGQAEGGLACAIEGGFILGDLNWKFSKSFTLWAPLQTTWTGWRSVSLCNRGWLHPWRFGLEVF